MNRLPVAIWTLGFVSMFMDISSEMIHAVLPLYLVTVLGASALTVGILEGIAEATASITKIFSGALSDWLGRRKLIVATGYGLAAFTKPVFALASSIPWIFAARFIDRIGKGIRGAPRDALIADLAPANVRGAAFGLRQALDTIGALIGPLLAIALMALTGDNYRAVFWFAVIPGLLSFAFVAFAVHDPETRQTAKPTALPIRRAELRKLGPAFWLVVAVAAVFSLARFSEAFLLLRAQSVGLSVTLVPAVMILMNVTYAVSAYPAGALSDRIDRVALLLVGLVVLAIADLALGLAAGIVAVGVGVLLWGLHLGLTQGLLSALVADAAPAQLRGTAFGIYNLISGLALLAASVIAGGLWERLGPEATFLAGGLFAAIAMVGLLLIRARLVEARARLTGG